MPGYKPAKKERGCVVGNIVGKTEDARAIGIDRFSSFPSPNESKPAESCNRRISDGLIRAAMFCSWSMVSRRATKSIVSCKSVGSVG